MGIIDTFFGGRSAVTSAMIRDDIARSQEEIDTLREQHCRALADLATMTDAEHVAAEAKSATTLRAIARLEARVSNLQEKLPAFVRAEQAAEHAAANELLRQRAEAARKANTKEAAKLLTEYDKLAAQVGDILTRLNEIVAEAAAVNAELRKSPVAEPVNLYNTVHRKSPDREESEERELRDVWVHHDGSVTEAKTDKEGHFIKPPREFDRVFGHYPQPVLDRREIVISRTRFRPGPYEAPLSAIHLPPGFAGGCAHWPRC